MNKYGSHSIKISEEAFLAIRAQQRTRETYGDVVTRLVRLAASLERASLEWQGAVKPESPPPGGPL